MSMQPKDLNAVIKYSLDLEAGDAILENGCRAKLQTDGDGRRYFVTMYELKLVRVYV